MIMTTKGDARVQAIDLLNLPAPVAKTPTHFPLPHSSVLSSLRLGIHARAEAWGVDTSTIETDYVISGEDAARCFALFTFRTGDDVERCIAMRNSHDMRVAMQVGGGHMTTVCTNMELFPAVAVGRKHTRNIVHQFPNLIEMALDKMSGSWKGQEDRHQEWRTADLSAAKVDMALMDCMRKGVLPSSKLKQAYETYMTPPHVEYSKGTAWTLHAAVTDTLRGSNLHNMERKTTQLGYIIDDTLPETW